MRKNNYLYDISITGSNISTLTSKLVANGLRLHNINRDKNSLFFSINEKDYRLFNSLDLSLYKIEISNYGGINYFKNKLISNMGIITGLIVSLVLFYLVSNRVFYINIIGLEKVSSVELEESLEAIGIKTFSKMPNSTDYIREHLEKSFDFSLVSVITKGNAIIINVKEEIENNIDCLDIVASFDMVIKDIIVYSGTSCVQKGDIVRNGQTLVYAYNINGEVKEPISPKAEIIATRFISKSYTFYNEEEVVLRTGNSKVVSCEYYLGNNKVYSDYSTHDFIDFEGVVFDKKISNYLIPIHLCKEVVYELKRDITKRDFEVEKEDILNNLRKECLKDAEGLNIVGEKEHIVKVDNGYVVNYYIETEVYLNY